METISFPDLLSMLPRGDEFRARKFLPGLSYVQSSNTSFVEPDLRIEYPAEHGKTSVVLLAAPGAVGKSTFAAELAHRTGALYWDLSKFQVGSQTFSGSILHAYDFEATGVLKRLPPLMTACAVIPFVSSSSCFGGSGHERQIL
jgi:hypothetical protein